ncbi:MAG: hypothetical protein K2X45_20895, partial [Phreatobacter sp.]|nr:hypothetical protein [Phreatobacter sp.]
TAASRPAGGPPPAPTVTYYEVSIQPTGVGSDQTYFPYWLSLARFPTSFWDDVREDGGNLRAYDAPGGTELALDVVSVMKYAKYGSAWVKLPTLFNAAVTRVYIGVLSSTTTRRARSDVLGMNGVWDDYESVFLGGELTPLADRAHPTRQFAARGEFTTFEYKVAGSPGAAEAEASFAPANQSRAGIAYDLATDERFLIDNNTLRRYSSTWTLLTTNANPIGDANTALGIGTLTTCGDACVVGSLLVVPMTNLGTNTVSAIACFNTTTLALVGVTNISATDAFISGLCWNEETSRLVSCSWGTMTALRRYSLDTGTGLVTADGSIALTVSGGSFVNDAQGIEHWKGSYWVASEVTNGVIRVDENGGCVYTERLVGYSSSAAALSGDYAGLVQYRDGFLILIWRSAADPNTFVYYQPMLDNARGGAGVRMPINDSGTSAARLQATGLASSTAFTIGATYERAQSAQQTIASYRNLASGATDNRATLAIQQSGIRYRYNLWDDINLWVYTFTTSASDLARVHGVYNGTERAIYADAVLFGSNTGITARGAAFDTFTIGVSDEDGDSASGWLSFIYLRLDARSLDWIEAETQMTSATAVNYYVQEVLDPVPTGMGDPVALLVVRKGSAAQNIDTSQQNMSFQDILINNGFTFSAGGSSFTVPAGVNFVTVDANAGMTAFGSGPFVMWIYRNSDIMLDKEVNTDFWFPMGLRAAFPVTPGDSITIRFQHFTGGTYALASTCRAAIAGWDV